MKKLLVLCMTFLMAFSLFGCAEKPNDSKNEETGGSTEGMVELNMEQVYEKLGQAATLPEMIKLEEAMILNLCGVAGEDVNQAVVAICADSLKTDEIWLMEAKDADAAKKIVAAANNRLETKGAESETYSPEQYAVVQQAKLLQKDNYIALIVSPDVDALAAAFRQEAGM